MKETVLVTIQGTQRDGETEETIETIHQGKHRVMAGKNIVLYEEIHLDEAQSSTTITKNIMKIEEDSLSLTKKGLIHTKMIFRKDFTHHGFYQTPFGIFDMTIHTTDLQITRQPDHYRLKIQYSLSLNKQHVSDCYLKIQIQEDERTK